MTLFTALLLSFQCLFRHPTIIGAGVPLPRGWGLRGRILPRSGGTGVERQREAQRCRPHLSLLGNGSAHTPFSLCGSKAASHPSPSLSPLGFVELAPGGLRAASAGAGVVGATFWADVLLPEGASKATASPKGRGLKVIFCRARLPISKRQVVGEGEGDPSRQDRDGAGHRVSCRAPTAAFAGGSQPRHEAGLQPFQLQAEQSTGTGAAFSSQV